MTQHIFVGEGAPVAAPLSVSAHYTDTLTGNQYVSIGTGSAADWRLTVLASAGRLMIMEPGEYPVGQELRAVYASIHAGDVVLTLTEAVIRGGSSFDLFVNGNEFESQPRRLVLRGPSEQEQLDIMFSAFQGDGYGAESGPGDNGQQVSFWVTESPQLWLSIRVVAGAVLAQRQDYLPPIM